LIGFIFLVLAASAVPSVVRRVRGYKGDAEDFFHLALALVFAGLMMYFSITSFLRARKISRS
jgi:hypothetical protein